ncbi:MAG: hypothetical protein ACM3X9_13750 [Bacillota bacterium]
MEKIDLEKLSKAREVILKMANGVNPLTGESIEKEHFLQDPRIIRCLFFIADSLKQQQEGAVYRNRRSNSFIISAEEKKQVQFTEGKIGVNEFSKCVNRVLDLTRSKKLTGVELNKRLKKMGLLAEEQTPDGKTRTTVNNQSLDYGFETELRNYNGNEYQMVLINDKGKRYLLDNLEIIMAEEA